MKKQSLPAIAFVILAVLPLGAHADDPPSASNVAAVVTNLWAAEQYQALESYITNLYATSSNYIPAKLAMSFCEYVYQGNITSAIAHVEQIKENSQTHPSNYGTNFLLLINQLSYELNEDKEMFSRWGSLSQITPSPSNTKAAWGADLPLPIEILLSAPSIHLQE